MFSFEGYDLRRVLFVKRPGQFHPSDSGSIHAESGNTAWSLPKPVFAADKLMRRVLYG